MQRDYRVGGGDGEVNGLIKLLQIHICALYLLSTEPLCHQRSQPKMTWRISSSASHNPTLSN